MFTSCTITRRSMGSRLVPPPCCCLSGSSSPRRAYQRMASAVRRRVRSSSRRRAMREDRLLGGVLRSRNAVESRSRSISTLQQGPTQREDSCPGECQEDALRVVADAANPSKADGCRLAIQRHSEEQGSIGRDDDDDQPIVRPRPRRALVDPDEPPTATPSMRRNPPEPNVRLHQRANGEALATVATTREYHCLPRTRDRSSGATTDVPFGDGHPRVAEYREGVVFGHGERIDVVQPSIQVSATPGRKAPGNDDLDQWRTGSVAHHSHLVGLSNPDRRASMPDSSNHRRPVVSPFPLNSGTRQRRRSTKPPPPESDHRHPGPSGPWLVLDDRNVADPHSRNISDGVAAPVGRCRW